MFIERVRLSKEVASEAKKELLCNNQTIRMCRKLAAIIGIWKKYLLFEILKAARTGDYRHRLAAHIKLSIFYYFGLWKSSDYIFFVTLK